MALSPAMGFRSKHMQWSSGFSRSKRQNLNRSKKSFHGTATAQMLSPLGTSAAVACKDCEGLKKSRQSLSHHVPVSFVTPLNAAWCTLLFLFSAALETHPDSALLTMKATVTATFFGKYSCCAATSCLCVCTALSYLISSCCLPLSPLDFMADEALSGR